MSDKTTGVMISQLPYAGGMEDDDYLEIERDKESKKVKVSDVAEYLGLNELAEALEELIG